MRCNFYSSHSFHRLVTSELWQGAAGPTTELDEGMHMHAMAALNFVICDVRKGILFVESS